MKIIPPDHDTEISKYFPLAQLFNMSGGFRYNDTYARLHVPPVKLPLPREFTIIYIDGWGCRDPNSTTEDIEHVRSVWSRERRLITPNSLMWEYNIIYDMFVNRKISYMI